MRKLRSCLTSLTLVLLLSTPVWAAQSVDLVAVNASGNYNVVSVGTTATLIPTTALSGRKTILLANGSGATIYLGFDSNLDTSNGTPFFDQSYLAFDVGENIAIYAVVSSGTKNLHYMEIR